MVRTLFLSAVFLASAVTAAPVPKDFKKETAKLDGAWQVTSYESNGRPLKGTAILQQRWTFDGENLSISRVAGPNAAPPPATLPATKLKCRTDAKKSPMEFDYIMASGTTRLGVFEVNGDTLTVCLTINTTGERPQSLDGGTGTLKYVFKRATEK